MLQDLRFALAAIVRRPFVAGAVILTLGLGVGANAAIFRAFNAAFLRPLPFQAEERLVRIYLAETEGSMGLSPRADVFLALRQHSRSLSGVAGQRFNDFTLIVDGEPQRVAGIEVSEGWATILGIAPQLGRTFSADEERQGAGAGVALISDSLWRERFSGARDVLQRTVNLDGRPFQVVGVLPAGLRFPYEAEVWVPTRFDESLESAWALNIVARLADGVTHAAAASELRALTGRLPEVRAQGGMRLSAVPLRETLIDDEGSIVVAVTIAAGLLLLLITVNVANLLAAHSMARRREFAIRTALGAGFGRVLRQTMTEGLVLAACAGAVGLGVASASTRLLAFLVPENFAYVLDAAPMDWRVVLFCAAIVAVTGVTFGAIPALRVARGAPQEALVGGRGTTEARPARVRAAIVTTAQLALALVLLIVAQAIIEDVQRRLAVDSGYDARGVLTGSIVLPDERYPGVAERNRFFAQLIDELRAIPGVDAAGTVNLFPAAGQGSLLARVEGEGVPYNAEVPLLAHNRLVHGSFGEAIGLRLVSGRLPSGDELRRGDPVAVISRELAGTLWPGQNPIGRRVRNRRLDDAPWLQVIGVVGDLQEHYADTRRALWQPVALNTAHAASAQASLVLRSRIAPGSLAASMRAAVRRIDPSLALFEIATAEELHRASLQGRASARTLTGAFAALGLLVAAIGVYASMAFAMTRRIREVAVRVALGATPRLLLRHFLGKAAIATGAGVTAGIAATFVLTRIGPGIASGFPVSLTSVVIAAIILSTVAMFASWLPLRRALRLEPSAVLQTE